MREGARRQHPGRAWRAPLLAILLVLVPALAYAHQYLTASDPSAGAELDVVPEQLRLTFSEPVRLQLTRVLLRSARTGEIALGALAVADDEPRELLVPIEGTVGPGAYTLEWVSAGADGHVVRGNLAFTVADDAAGLPDAAEPIGSESPAAPHHDPDIFPASASFGVQSPGYVVIRWATFTALVVLLGAVSFRTLIVPRAARHSSMNAAFAAPASMNAAALGAAAAFVLVLAAVARLFAQSYSMFGTGEAFTGASLAQFVQGSLWAWGWWLQVGAGLLALGSLLAVRLARGGAAYWAVAALATLALAWTPALSGHASAPSQPATAILASGVHVVAAGGWLGTLLLLLAAGIPAVRATQPRSWPHGVAALVNAFSPLALFFAAMLVATGLYALWLHAGSLALLLESDYGRVLLLKLGLLSVVGATGAYNFLRVRPALAEEAGAVRLNRSARLELVAGLAVLLATAVLVATPPPMDADTFADRRTPEAAARR
jgi:putative copper export protein/methionine-rich copper-binding protein CopC